MKKMILTFAVLLITAMMMGGVTGSIEVPPEAKAVTVGGRNYWQVEDMLVERSDNPILEIIF